MCRMIGFLSVEPRDVAPYFGELQRQAECGIEHPHKTGWGFSIYEETTPAVDRKLGAIYDQSYAGPATGYSGLLHARKASDRSTTGDVESLHPFQFTLKGVVWSFAHNGTIREIPSEWRRATDSKAFVDLIDEHMTDGQRAVDALRSTAILLNHKCRPNSLNCFLVSPNEFLALQSSADDSHRLFYASSDRVFQISTEIPVAPLGDARDRWIELTQNQILRATPVNGHITLKTFGL